ncbi:MAG TPA: FAD-dependent oxidoreductase [Nitrospirae bacterium]|nr:UDP-galactopyranose mutase [bacterium BMS3Abin08]HDY72226.1 FAD-dependent oxidoreductase [Nitrospirota bacterium]
MDVLQGKVHIIINNGAPYSKVKPPRKIVILGAGLAGLSAAYILSKAGRKVIVFESDSTVGGLSKTVNCRGFSFDLGGHRFITRNKKIEQFVMELLNGDFLVVPRKSKIYMLNRYFDYPLRPANAVLGLGLSTTLQIISDYCKERVKNTLRPPEIVSLEDWVINQFGRKMFDIYFKEYSEKVWGIECRRISKEWVAQRIKGLSLWAAIKNGFFKFSGKEIDTLSDKFVYPPMGIGQISEKLKERIEERENPVLTSTMAMQINHEDFCIKTVVAKNCERSYDVKGSEFVSSIPLTNLVQLLNPAAPEDVVEASSQLKYRDLIIVTIMLNRERVTDLTWMYLPEEEIPLGRIHEPKNWSPTMAPEGKTHIVAEYFCFKGDKIWNSSDEELTSTTVGHLEKLGFTNKDEVIDSYVLRVPKAYPLFEIGYREHYSKILRYLQNFKNLHIIGRSGMFRYYNMDHAMESGIEVAEHILRMPLLEGERNSLLIGA